MLVSVPTVEQKRRVESFVLIVEVPCNKEIKGLGFKSGNCITFLKDLETPIPEKDKRDLEFSPFPFFLSQWKSMEAFSLQRSVWFFRSASDRNIGISFVLLRI